MKKMILLSALMIAGTVSAHARVLTCEVTSQDASHSTLRIEGDSNRKVSFINNQNGKVDVSFKLTYSQTTNQHSYYLGQSRDRSFELRLYQDDGQIYADFYLVSEATGEETYITSQCK